MHKSHLLILVAVLFLTSCVGNVATQEEDAPVSAPIQVEPTAIPEVVSKSPPPSSCPVTVSQEPPFVPPTPYDTLGFKGYFWFGNAGLWTSLPQDGAWYGLPENPEGFTQKVFWWRDGYVWNEEPEPNLVVTGERLDAKSPPLSVSRATNAYASDIGSAMLVGVDFPTEGCWKVTGQYGKAELSFVVWVGS